jgi:hypothetical protein
VNEQRVRTSGVVLFSQEFKVFQAAKNSVRSFYQNQCSRKIEDYKSGFSLNYHDLTVFSNA